MMFWLRFWTSVACLLSIGANLYLADVAHHRIQRADKMITELEAATKKLDAILLQPPNPTFAAVDTPDGGFSMKASCPVGFIVKYPKTTQRVGYAEAINRILQATCEGASKA